MKPSGWVAALGPTFRLLAAILALLPFGLRAAEGFSKLPDVADLTAIFQPLRYDRAKLSPDGRYVAYTQTEPTTASATTGEYHVSIIIRRVDSPDSFSTVDGGERVSFLGWASADRLVYTSNHTDIAYLIPPGMGDGEHVGEGGAFFDDGLIETIGPRSTEIHSVDPLGKNDRMLMNTEDTRPDQQIPRMRRPAVLHLPRARDSRLIVEAQDGNEIGFFRVNVLTGRRETIVDRDFKSGLILADQSGLPRLSLAEASPLRVLYSENSGKTWSEFDPTIGTKAGLHFETDAANFFGRHELPVAFDLDSEVLYYASNVGRDTFGLYSINLRTKTRTPFRLEDPAFDLVNPARPFPSAPLIWDRFSGHLLGVRVNGVEPSTHWLDPELEKIQREIDANFSSKTVEIVDWDQSRRRFLLLTTGESDPGRYYIFEPANAAYTQFLRREPSREADEVSPTRSFSIPRDHAPSLTGYITQPLDPIITPAPILIVLHDGPWQRAIPDYNHDMQALAAMGFVVVQLNYTGSRGFGTAFARALQAGFDRVPIDDMLAAVAWVSAQENSTKPRRVALLGRGFGGYLALRAIELHPEAFSCAVALAPILDLEDEANSLARQWPVEAQARANLYRGSAVPLAGLSALRHPERVTRPIMFVQNPERNATQRALPSGGGLIKVEDAQIGKVRELSESLRKAGRTVAYLEVRPGFGTVPTARAQGFYRIEQFLAEHVYNFNVEIGEPTVEGEK